MNRAFHELLLDFSSGMHRYIFSCNNEVDLSIDQVGEIVGQGLQK